MHHYEWGEFTHTALLERAESKAFCLICSPLPTDSLPSLTLRCNVASLPIFYTYFHTSCSSELANCMFLLLALPRCTRLSVLAHPYTVQSPYAWVDQYFHYFFLFTGKLWHCLPFSVFLSVYDLNGVKRWVSRHLLDRNCINFFTCFFISLRIFIFTLLAL